MPVTSEQTSLMINFPPEVLEGVDHFRGRAQTDLSRLSAFRTLIESGLRLCKLHPFKPGLCPTPGRDATRIQVIVSRELYAKITDYFYESRSRSRKSASLDLICFALQTYLPDKGVPREREARSSASRSSSPLR
jgi:hypothetical protein